MCPPETLESTATDPASTEELTSLSARRFSHEPPFDAAFAERVPLLQAFNLALQSFMRHRATRASTWSARLRRWLKPEQQAFRAAECGVFTGSSLLACAALARDARVPFRMIGMDTFEGLPPLSEKDRAFARPKARYLRQPMFTETSVDNVRDLIRSSGFGDSVEVRAGLFSETLPHLEEQRWHFVNVDCDLYEPHLECLEYFYPRMVPGGVVFFDDYHSVDYPMAGRAVDDFMRGRPEQLMHLRFGADGPNRTKSFFIKY